MSRECHRTPSIDSEILLIQALHSLLETKATAFRTTLWQEEVCCTQPLPYRSMKDCCRNAGSEGIASYTLEESSRTSIPACLDDRSLRTQFLLDACLGPNIAEKEGYLQGITHKPRNFYTRENHSCHRNIPWVTEHILHKKQPQLSQKHRPINSKCSKWLLTSKEAFL